MADLENGGPENDGPQLVECNEMTSVETDKSSGLKS
jgi:hypothetical protein